MCFDKDSSLLAWTISYTIAMFLFYRNRNFDRWNAGFIICFATIQLLEAGLWSVYEEKTKNEHSKEITDLITRLILIALVTQPLFQTYLGYKHLPKENAISDGLKLMCFVFIGILLWSFYRIWKSKPGEFSSQPGPNGHMIWTDSKYPNNFLGGAGGIMIGVLYFIGLFVPLLAMAYFSSGTAVNKGPLGVYGPLLLLLVGITTAIYSLKYAAPKEFSSYWCFVAVAYSLTSLFV